MAAYGYVHATFLLRRAKRRRGGGEGDLLHLELKEPKLHFRGCTLTSTASRNVKTKNTLKTNARSIELDRFFTVHANDTNKTRRRQTCCVMFSPPISLRLSVSLFLSLCVLVVCVALFRARHQCILSRFFPSPSRAKRPRACMHLRGENKFSGKG